MLRNGNQYCIKYGKYRNTTIRKYEAFLKSI